MLNRTHLSFEERCIIEKELNFNQSLTRIAEKLDRSKSTISREIRRHPHLITISTTKKTLNPCAIQKHCVQKGLCPIAQCYFEHHSFCRYCQHCIKHCPDFVKANCPRLNKAPYVCNGCPERHGCLYPKTYYRALAAQRSYSQLLSKQRQGLSLDLEELHWVSKTLEHGLNRGLSPHVIYLDYKDEMPCSERSLYRYVNQGVLKPERMDLPMAVRYRQRRKKKQHKIDTSCRMGRTYKDFLAYRKEHPDLPVVQMDSVEGKRGCQKVFLTLFFENTSVLLLFLRERNTSQSVIDIFDQLTQDLGLTQFQSLFPVILTDNGSEFSNPQRLERTADGIGRTRIFYCDPGRPDQKGAIENAHLLLRKILPKGSSFDDLSKQEVRLIASHVNSYKRKKLNDKSPIDLVSFFHGDKILSVFDLTPIPPDEITLSTALLRMKEEHFHGSC